jgi:outer membrane protein OmpA-like peptidoglycan-associated protein
MTPRPFVAALGGALATVFAARPALAGPDFVTADRAEPLAASDARNVQQPLDDVVFAYDSAALPPTAQAQLVAAARWLEVHPTHRLVVEGYADSSGPAAYNEDLATRRSQIARNHLIASGVAADRIVVAVYGENRARRRPHPLDRRVVIFASEAPLSQVVSAELDRDAIELSWTRNGSVYRETRGITPVAAIAPDAARNRAVGRHGG